jgi:predicted dehydrogenase
MADYAVWVIDSKPVQVFALGHKKNPDYYGPDEATIAVRFENGAIATLHLSFNVPVEISEKVIIGDKGVMRIFNDSEVWVNGVLREKFEENLEYLKGGLNFERQIQEFADSINTGKEPLTSASSCRGVVAIVEGATRSVHEGTAIDLS